MRGMGWERGGGNQRGNARKLGVTVKNVRNQRGDAGNQGRHLSVVVEIT